MNNPLLTKSLLSAGAILAHRIVKFDGSGSVVASTAVADKGIGITDDLDVVSGEPVDVIVVGIAPVTYGGAVTEGDFLTSGTDGKAVAVTASTDVVIGQAMVTGVDGDTGSIKL